MSTMTGFLRRVLFSACGPISANQRIILRKQKDSDMSISTWFFAEKKFIFFNKKLYLVDTKDRQKTGNLYLIHLWHNKHFTIVIVPDANRHLSYFHFFHITANSAVDHHICYCVFTYFFNPSRKVSKFLLRIYHFVSSQLCRLISFKRITKQIDRLLFQVCARFFKAISLGFFQCLRLFIIIVWRNFLEMFQTRLFFLKSRRTNHRRISPQLLRYLLLVTPVHPRSEGHMWTRPWI